MAFHLGTVRTVERPTEAPEVPKKPINPERRTPEKGRGKKIALFVGGAVLIAATAGVGVAVSGGKSPASTTTAPTTTEVPTTTAPETRPQSVEIMGVVFDGQETQVKPIYDAIDWTTRDSILATGPEPRYSYMSAEGPLNAQDIVDNYMLNTSMWNVTKGLGYDEAMGGDVGSDYYDQYIAPYWESGAEFNMYVSWGQVIEIQASEQGDGVTITGQGVEYRAEIGLDGVEIKGFSMTITKDTSEDGRNIWRPVVFRWDEEPLFERYNHSDDTPFELWNHGSIELPWQGYQGDD